MGFLNVVCLALTLFLLAKQVGKTAMAVLESDACSDCHTVERILRDVERDMDLVCQTFVKTAEESATTSEVDTVVYDVGIELRGRLLES